VAVLYIALPAFKESEGYDRTDLDLTTQQIALIKAVSRVQPNTVVVLNNGAPVVMGEWIDGVAAVLEGWMMGQAGGAAIADVLFGKVNPSGKLAETFPLKLSDTPAHLNWPGGAGEVRYGEGLFIGYRYYDAKEMPVLFPFGHGLSYTTFAYSNARVSAATFKDIDGLTVAVDVTNTGSVAGKEIVQVYVHDRKSGLVRPQKELKGFSKVELQPGETRTVSIQLDFRAFAYYHPKYRQDYRGRGVRHPDRCFCSRYPLPRDGDAPIDPRPALHYRQRIDRQGVDGRPARKSRAGAALQAD
jgi:beta-glucosidase